MQATAISNPSTANTPNTAPAAASVLPFDPQQASPFSAAFQTALKGAATTGKAPAASKPQDSSRGSANATAAGNNPLGLFLPGMVAPALAPIPIEPSLPAGAPQSLVGASGLNGEINQGTNASGNLFPLNSGMDVPAGAGQANASAPNSLGSSSATLDPMGSLGDDETAPEAGASPQDLKSALQIAANQIDLGAIPNSSNNVSQDAHSPQSGASNSTSVPDPTNVFLPVAAEQNISSGRIADSKLVPQDSASSAVQEGSVNKLFENLLQPSSGPASPQPGPQNILANSATPSADKAAQTARTGMKFLNLQTLIPAGAATKASLSASAQPPSNHDPQPNFPAPAITSPTLTETLEHSAAKSAAVGAPTLKFHDNAKSQSDNSAPSVPVPAVSAKSQSQDGSNCSAGNDSNSKQDHSSTVASVRADDKGFVQTLDAAAANPATGHAAVPDPTAVAAAVPLAVPVQPQAAHSGAQQPAAANGADLHPSESLPAASQGSAVVNAAHITVQPGQTEIRIEMQAESLGGVELRAHIAGDQIGASISVEHHDAQVALTTDLPALHNALAEKNLRLESFTVSQGSFSSLSGGLGHDAGQRGFPQGHTPAKFAYLEQPETLQSYAETPAEGSGAARPGAGLSVVA